MTIEMLVTSVHPEKHFDGHQIMEEIGLRSVEGYVPTAEMRFRIRNPEQFGKFPLHSKVKIEL